MSSKTDAARRARPAALDGQSGVGPRTLRDVPTTRTPGSTTPAAPRPNAAPVSLVGRLARHARLTWRGLAVPPVASPPFLILFINSLCNMRCEHCFYWQQLNQPDDLSFDELVALSEDLGPLENLNLSGGEPFLRKEFAAICRQFIRQNGVKEIYVPTNASSTDRTVAAIRGVLEEPNLRLFVVELSLDGMPAFHDDFRKARQSFRRAMETYDALAAVQQEDPRLQIHAISTATDRNLGEIRMLTTFLFDRCPRLGHHNLAIIRGDRKNPTLKGPALRAYQDLYQYMRRLWRPREHRRYGSIVEPMLQRAKLKAAEQEEQFVPCRAGVLSAVVHANGDVGVCEQRPPIGNLREKPFMEIWRSHVAADVRRSIRHRECYCTNEIFMWPSIVFQPEPLVRCLVGSRAWAQAEPLRDDERADYSEAARPLTEPVRSA